ncbi:MAG: response regulator, partial [Oscillospiraceae bacterium]|nr:response regulator [Oscillospiraceae bacterium]
IDESQPLKETLCKFFEKDYEVITTELSTEPGYNLLEYVAEKQPDLILMDIVMSGANHFEFLAALKTSKITNTIPVIIVTRASEGENRLIGLSLGAADYIVKPFLPLELKARIEVQLRTINQPRRTKKFS